MPRININYPTNDTSGPIKRTDEEKERASDREREREREREEGRNKGRVDVMRKEAVRL